MQDAARDIDAEPRYVEQIRNIIGLGLEEAIQALYPAGDWQFIQAFSGAYRRHYLSVNRTPSRLFEGTGKVLTNLNAEGYLLAVATGKARRGLKRALVAAGLAGLFQASRCADEAFSKPHPQMLQDIITTLGVLPEETLMIGDTEYDIQMSHSAGAHALAVSYGAHALERLLRHEPLGYIDAITELPEWLNQHDMRAIPV